MVDQEKINDLVNTGINIFAFGDPGQLPPVNGEPFFAFPSRRAPLSAAYGNEKSVSAGNSTIFARAAEFLALYACQSPSQAYESYEVPASGNPSREDIERLRITRHSTTIACSMSSV